MRNSFGKPGFSLIEVVMVIVIAGILAGLAIPRFDSFFAIKLDGAVKKMVSDIRYVQQLAVARHENYAITFNTGNNSYRGYRVLDNSPVNDPFTQQYLDPWINFNTDLQYPGITIFNANFGGVPTVVFDWQGAPSSAGSVELRCKGNSRVISITANTARISVQ